MADSSLSPCKVSLNGAFRRFLIARPAAWRDFENKIRTVYNLPATVALDVQYKDEEGDVITLNTDSELDDVLAMHALFSQVTPVKFEVTAYGNHEQQSEQEETAQRNQQLQQLEDELQGQLLSTNVTSDQILPQLTSWRLNDHNQTYSSRDLSPRDLSSTITSESITSPLNHPLQHSNSPYGSDHSDDVSLIELEDGTESRLGDELSRTHDDIMDEDQTITYPQRDLVEAVTLQERLEAYKIDAPVFKSSLRTSVEDDNGSVSTGLDQSGVASHHIEQPTVTSTTPESDISSATVDASASSAAQEKTVPSFASSPFFDSTHLKDVLATSQSISQSRVELTEGDESSVEEYHELEEPNDVETVVKVEADADPEEQALPSTSTASTSTSEHNADSDERALIEQFQQLVKEFQDIIHNNPQLVTLAGSIMNKILSNAKVNVASFATYLQTQAQTAAQSAQEAASHAAAQAQEAAAQAQEAAAQAAAQIQETASHAAAQAQEAAAQAAAQIQETASHAAAKAQEAASKAKAGNFGPNSRYPHHGHHHHAEHPRSPFGHRHSYYGHVPHNHAFSNPFGFGPSMPPMPPAPPMSPLVMLRMPPMPPMPPMPTMPPMPPTPPTPSFSLSTEASSSSGLGRSNTVPSSKPSPFSRGFPFVNTPSMPPIQIQRANSYKSDRPVLGDTEASLTSSRSSHTAKYGKGKATGAEPITKDQGSSSSSFSSATSAMPGSFPDQPPMFEGKPGWTWTRLPDEGSEHHQPPSTRAKYGWVWNDIGGEKTEIEEVEQTPLYTPLDEAESTPGSFPVHPGSFDFGPFRSHGKFRGFGRVFANTQSNGETAVNASEKLKIRQTFLEFNDDSSSGQAPAPLDTPLDSNNTAPSEYTRLREQIEEQRKALEEQRKLGMDERRTSRQFRQEQAQKMFEPMAAPLGHPLSHYASFTSASSASTPPRRLVVGAGSLTDIWPSSGRNVEVTTTAASATSTSTPGDFPRAPIAAPVTTGAIPRTTPVAVPVQAPAHVAAPTAADVDTDVNPFADPSEFEEEIKTLVGMGFEDNAELRTVVRDFGGELEAIVEFLVSH